MDAGFTGSARPPQPITATVAPKAGEAVSPQARTDLPETKTVTPPTESTAVRFDKKRVRDEERKREKDRQRKRDPLAWQITEDEIASLSDQAASAFVSAFVSGYISGDAPSPARPQSGMRAYQEKLAGERNPPQHRVEKLA